MLITRQLRCCWRTCSRGRKYLALSGAPKSTRSPGLSPFQQSSRRTHEQLRHLLCHQHGLAAGQGVPWSWPRGPRGRGKERQLDRASVLFKHEWTHSFSDCYTPVACQTTRTKGLGILAVRSESHSHTHTHISDLSFAGGPLSCDVNEMSQHFTSRRIVDVRNRLVDLRVCSVVTEVLPPAQRHKEAAALQAARTAGAHCRLCSCVLQWPAKWSVIRGSSHPGLAELRWEGHAQPHPPDTLLSALSGSAFFCGATCCSGTPIRNSCRQYGRRVFVCARILRVLQSIARPERSSPHTIQSVPLLATPVLTFKEDLSISVIKRIELEDSVPLTSSFDMYVFPSETSRCYPSTGPGQFYPTIFRHAARPFKFADFS